MLRITCLLAMTWPLLMAIVSGSGYYDYPEPVIHAYNIDGETINAHIDFPGTDYMLDAVEVRAWNIDAYVNCGFGPKLLLNPIKWLNTIDVVGDKGTSLTAPDLSIGQEDISFGLYPIETRALNIVLRASRTELYCPEDKHKRNYCGEVIVHFRVVYDCYDANGWWQGITFQTSATVPECRSAATLGLGASGNYGTDSYYTSEYDTTDYSDFFSDSDDYVTLGDVDEFSSVHAFATASSGPTSATGIESVLNSESAVSFNATTSAAVSAVFSTVAASIDSAPSGAITFVTTEIPSTTVITITSCSDNKCSQRTATTGITTITATISDVVTVFTTYCPLKGIIVTKTYTPTTNSPADPSTGSCDSASTANTTTAIAGSSSGDPAASTTGHFSGDVQSADVLTSSAASTTAAVSTYAGVAPSALPLTGTVLGSLAFLFVVFV